MREFYGEYGGTSCVLRFLDSWLLLVTAGPPTPDKPTVTLAPPDDPDLRRCGAHHRRARLPRRSRRPPGAGGTVLAPPVESPWEIRAFFRDPDGHLFEISERRRQP